MTTGKWNENEPHCIFNPHVLCGIGIYGNCDFMPENCEDCGWNPEEQRRRAEKLRKEAKK